MRKGILVDSCGTLQGTMQSLPFHFSFTASPHHSNLSSNRTFSACSPGLSNNFQPPVLSAAPFCPHLPPGRVKKRHPVFPDCPGKEDYAFRCHKVEITDACVLMDGFSCRAVQELRRKPPGKAACILKTDDRKKARTLQQTLLTAPAE